MRLLFIYFFKGFFFPKSPEGGLGCGSGNAAALPRGSEVTRPWQPGLCAAARPLLAFTAGSARPAPLDAFPEGWGWICELLFPAPEVPSKPCPAGRRSVPFTVALPPLPSLCGASGHEHRSGLGFLQGILAVMGARSEEKRHGHPTPSRCSRPPHKGQGDAVRAVKFSQLSEHPRGLQQLGCVTACPRPAVSQLWWHLPAPCPASPGEGSCGWGCFWAAWALGLFSRRSRALSGSGSDTRCQEQMAAIGRAASQIPVAPGTVLGSGSS